MHADLQRAASGLQVAAMAAPPTRADYYGENDYPQDRTQRMGQNTMMAGAATGQYPQRTGGFNAQTYGGDGGYPPERKSWARRWLPWLIPAAVIIAVIAVAASLLDEQRQDVLRAASGRPDTGGRYLADEAGGLQ